MSRSIRLSEKHGVNPSLINCFFCGESKGIALMGRLKDDAEAPRSCVMDYEPCDKCKAMFDRGVLLIGVTSTQPSDGRPPLTAQGGASVYPTGAHAVITPDAASRLFNIQREWKCGDKLFIDHEMLVQMTTPPRTVRTKTLTHGTSPRWCLVVSALECSKRMNEGVLRP